MQELKDPVQQARHVECNHWLGMMGRLQDPVVARLVLGFFNENMRLRDQHPGAFLIAAETVKRDQIRYAKAYAWGRLARAVTVATGRGTFVTVERLIAMASLGFRAGRKLAHAMSQHSTAQVKAGASAPTWRRCVVRQRRDELPAQRGAMRART